MEGAQREPLRQQSGRGEIAVNEFRAQLNRVRRESAVGVNATTAAITGFQHDHR